MLIKEALKSGCGRIGNPGSTALLDARILLCHILKISHEQLLISYNDEIDNHSLGLYYSLIERRKNFEPIAYIIGRQEFYGRAYNINNSVLIPRPETELLIDAFLSQVPSSKEIKVLELGTGSGVLAITIALELPCANITAVDISADALKVAYKNARLHRALEKIRFIKSNWFNAIEEKDFDYIVANPPYISHKERHLVAKSTDVYEPHQALYAENDGLKAYQEIIASALSFLKESGKIFLEIGYAQKDPVSELMHVAGFKNITVMQDISGLDRLIIARKGEFLM